MTNHLFSEGLWPVMLTPFKDNNNEPDLGVLEGLIEFYIQTGANGLFSICQSSEMFQLTEAERLSIVSTTVKHAAIKNLEVVSTGTFSSDLNQCADYIKKVYDTGVSAVIVIANQLATLEDDEKVLKNNIEDLLKLTGTIPLGIYECPYPYKRLLSAELMKWLSQSDRFFYHKDTSCNPGAIQKKIEAMQGSNNSFYNANTATALDSLKMGGNGISPIGANAYPELYSYLFREFKERGSRPELQRLNAQLDLLDSIISQCYPFSAKQLLQLRGMKLTTHCRISYQYLQVENYMKLKSTKRIFDEILDEYGIDNLFK